VDGEEAFRVGRERLIGGEESSKREIAPVETES
jgi:hypothetical protein